MALCDKNRSQSRSSSSCSEGEEDVSPNCSSVDRDGGNKPVRTPSKRPADPESPSNKESPCASSLVNNMDLDSPKQHVSSEVEVSNSRRKLQLTDNADSNTTSPRALSQEMLPSRSDFIACMHFFCFLCLSHALTHIQLANSVSSSEQPQSPPNQISRSEWEISLSYDVMLPCVG